jgi:hypothetical protein
MLYNLQASGAKTFLLTNSEWKYTNQVNQPSMFAEGIVAARIIITLGFFQTVVNDVVPVPVFVFRTCTGTACELRHLFWTNF